jgi:hypothetical protein
MVSANFDRCAPRDRMESKLTVLCACDRRWLAAIEKVRNAAGKRLIVPLNRSRQDAG